MQSGPTWRDSTMLNLSDDVLMARIVRGDEPAFMTVYDRYADSVFGTSVRFVRDRELAAEIVQDVFLAVWHRAGQFDPSAGSLAGWIFGIARNRAVDRLRAEARRPVAARPRPDTGSQPGDLLDHATYASSHAGPDRDEPAEEIDRRWLRAVIRTALSELGTDERDVLILAYDLGLSQSDIAARLRLPIGTVKSRTRRALARLRTNLEGVPDLRVEEPGWSVVAGEPGR